MLNNYTECRSKYESCSVIIAESGTRGALLIGDFNSATDSQLLANNNVKTVITAAAGMEHLQIPHGITHIVYPLLDASSENIKRFFAESTAAIESSLLKGGVLVHCVAGISRSTTLVVAYLIKTRKITFKDAMALIRFKRSNVCPNLGFERQLKKYEKEVSAKNAFQRILTKKTVSERLGEERRSSSNSYLNYNPIKKLNQYFKLQPHTAEQCLSSKVPVPKRTLVSQSKSRPSVSRNRKVAPVTGKEDLMILGHGSKEIIRMNDQKIKCPVIKSYLPSALSAAWARFRKQKVRS